MKPLCLTFLLCLFTLPVWAQVAFDDPISLKEGLDELGVRGGVITATNGDTVYVFWNPWDGPPIEQSQLYFSRSMDGGQSFEEPRSIMQGVGLRVIPVKVVVRSEYIFAVFTTGIDYFSFGPIGCTSQDGGESLTCTRLIPAGSSVGSDIQLEVTEKGDFYAAWTGISMSAGEPANVFLYSSRFGGINVTNHQVGRESHSAFQQLAVKGDEIWLLYTTVNERPPVTRTPFILHGTVE